MLTYENFVSVLLSVIERCRLNIAYTQELLDTHALGRSLSITCLPDGVVDDNRPVEPPLRAVLTFRWSPEFTVFSLRGADSLDNIERFVDERLFAQRVDTPSMDIEMTYHLPVPDDQRDIRALSALAHTIQELHGTLVEEDEVVRVDSVISYGPGGAPRLQSVSAQRIWSIDEALYDADLLAVTFEELCAELHAMLQLLHANFAPPEEEAAPGDADLTDRRYLKPPTA
jgi:hypothetical protein